MGKRKPEDGDESKPKRVRTRSMDLKEPLEGPLKSSKKKKDKKSKKDKKDKETETEGQEAGNEGRQQAGNPDFGSIRIVVAFTSTPLQCKKREGEGARCTL